MARPGYFALTNAHGLRLAIQATRVGLPPRAAAPAEDVQALAGGLPVVVHGSPPSAVAGTRGPVVALQVDGRRVRSLALAGTSREDAWILPRPLSFDAVLSAHFQSTAECEEFAAGLAVLEEGSPPQLQLKVSPSLFGASWDGIQPSSDGVVADAGRLRLALERQGRVSAAMLLGAAVAGDEGWEDPGIMDLRQKVSPSRKGQVSGAPERALARGLAQVDPLSGWGLAELESAFSNGGADLADYIRTWTEAQDPFADVMAPTPGTDAEKALDLVLGCAGLAPREFADQVVASARDFGGPRVAALAGLLLGRHLLPRALRPASRDDSLAREELVAATRKGKDTPPKTPQRASPAVPAVEQIGLFD